MYEIHKRKLKLFSCEICGKKYFDKEGLQYHMFKSHTEILYEPESSSIQMQECFQNQSHHLPSIKSIQPNMNLTQRPQKQDKNIPTYKTMLPYLSNNPINLLQAFINLCSFCDLSFQNPTDVMNHIDLNHPQGQYTAIHQSKEQLLLNNQTNTASTFHQENRKSVQTFNTFVSTETGSIQSFYANSYQVQSDIRIVKTAEFCTTNTKIHPEHQTSGIYKEMSTVSKKIPHTGDTESLDRCGS